MNGTFCKADSNTLLSVTWAAKPASMPENKFALAPKVALGPLIATDNVFEPNSGSTKFLTKTLNLKALPKTVVTGAALVTPSTGKIVEKGLTTTKAPLESCSSGKLLYETPNLIRSPLTKSLKPASAKPVMPAIKSVLVNESSTTLISFFGSTTLTLTSTTFGPTVTLWV